MNDNNGTAWAAARLLPHKGEPLAPAQALLRRDAGGTWRVVIVGPNPAAAGSEEEGCPPRRWSSSFFGGGVLALATGGWMVDRRCRTESESSMDHSRRAGRALIGIALAASVAVTGLAATGCSCSRTSARPAVDRHSGHRSRRDQQAAVGRAKGHAGQLQAEEEGLQDHRGAVGKGVRRGLVGHGGGRAPPTPRCPRPWSC